jgi:predicted amidohydrolase YtcJ
MSASRRRFGSASAVLAVLTLVAGCAFVATGSPTSSSCSAGDGPATTKAAGHGSEEGDLVIVGRIVTMSEPAVVEGVLIEGGLVTCVGTRDEVLALAGDEVQVVDIGANVAYPGFIDAHAHWIGHRGLAELDSAEEAMDAALRRGWTSISEQMVTPDHLAELTALAEDDALRLRVDAYLFLTSGGEFSRNGYADRGPGPIGDRLRVQGLKIGLADGPGPGNWEPADLTETIGRANEAGWQVSVHAVSTGAEDLALDAYEAALGPAGPNPLHHRIEHATEVSDDQLARMVAMDLVTVIHPDGSAVDWVLWDEYMDLGADHPAGQIGWLSRWRDFVEAGLHVAAATDAPWFSPFSPETALTEGIGRPADQIAGGIEGRGPEFPKIPIWIRDQSLTAEQGLRAVTLDAAYALRDETRRGHLSSGTLGDVSILSGDVTDATSDEIREMEVIATIVGGVVVYCSNSEVCGQE